MIFKHKLAENHLHNAQTTEILSSDGSTDLISDGTGVVNWDISRGSVEPQNHNPLIDTSSELIFRKKLLGNLTPHHEKSKRQ
uniref:Uncharacterized protein n=1 Tax=Physcomitrium patens TaxID=3218 RepID=A0A2K1JGZ0_PHYPA|nr:hypothetical protein PHYPA_018224 [Physcomitrium patens]